MICEVKSEERGDGARVFEELQAVQRRLSRIEAGVITRAGDAATRLSDDALAASAREIYAARRRRTEMFGSDLFGEPAWDMLLDLFIAMVRSERVATTSLCIAAEVPVTTGLRRIERLEERGLVARTVGPDDARYTLIELTAPGYRLMRAFVAEWTCRLNAQSAA